MLLILFILLLTMFSALALICSREVVGDDEVIQEQTTCTRVRGVEVLGQQQVIQSPRSFVERARLAAAPD